MKNLPILRHGESSLLVMLTLSTLLLAGCNDKSAPVSMAPPEVSAAQVVVKPVNQWDEYSGRIEAIQSVELRPRVSGYLESVNYREGQEVKKGDVLFTIDARTYRAELARANAQLARAASVAVQGRNEARRAKVLVAQHAISTELWEQRNAADKSAQADRVRARIAASNAQAAGDLASYQKTVLTALEETENALAQVSNSEQQRQHLEQAAAASVRASGVAKVRFDQGAIDLLTLLDAENVRLQSQDALAQGQVRYTLAVVSLYRAMAGGWPEYVASEASDKR